MKRDSRLGSIVNVSVPLVHFAEGKPVPIRSGGTSLSPEGKLSLRRTWVVKTNFLLKQGHLFPKNAIKCVLISDLRCSQTLERYTRLAAPLGSAVSVITSATCGSYFIPLSCRESQAKDLEIKKH